MSSEERYVREELAKVYPQLIINARKCAGAGFHQYGMDCLAVACRMFLEKPLEQQLKTIKDGKLENFITFILNMQLKSSSSHFYQYYRKPSTAIREYYEGTKDYGNNDIKEDFSDTLDCIDRYKKKCNVFEQMIIEEHFRNGRSYTSIGNEYNIGYYSIRQEAKRMKKEIKRLCQKFL